VLLQYLREMVIHHDCELRLQLFLFYEFQPLFKEGCPRPRLCSREILDHSSEDSRPQYETKSGGQAL